MAEPKTASLIAGDTKFELPVVVGSENEKGLDISKLRANTGLITLDNGFANTGSCKSSITFIDGEHGVLRYRGIPIEQLAEQSNFVETSWFLIYGRLPTPLELKQFKNRLVQHEMLHEGLIKLFDNFPPKSHPMASLSALINACSCYYPEIIEMEDESTFDLAVARLMSKVRTIAAASFKKLRGHPISYPDPALPYCANFLHMMFSIPNRRYELDPDVVRALNLILILHADHEQNCSTSTVRMVASSGANLFASCASGVCALWGPLHGGANAAVIKMLQQIHDDKIDLKDYINTVKDKSAGIRLMGFGHRVYKSRDPRAEILKAMANRLLNKLNVEDPLMDIARHLEDVALNDDYFIERNLYPNVDFYSGIILQTIGIPVDMFTVIFAIGRMPGWIAHWKEVWEDKNGRISRPRQIYTGPTATNYTPIKAR